MRTRSVLRLGLLAAVMALAGACLSPTLPLPPPEEPDTMQPSKEDPDVWIVSGTCRPGAKVVVFDEDSNVGGVNLDEDRDGRYTVELVHAKRCDLVSVSQAVGTDSNGEEASAETTFVLQEKTAAGVADPNACK